MRHYRFSHLLGPRAMYPARQSAPGFFWGAERWDRNIALLPHSRDTSVH